MRVLVALCLLAVVAGASAQCPQTCRTMKWATCETSPCQCTVPVDEGAKQVLNCNSLVPKCFLMKAEMYRARHNLATRTFGGKPVDTAIVDNDGIYDPVCENNGAFKAIQCNNTETCWCVNSAGVRRSDKGDKTIQCEPVETYWIRLELTLKPPSASVDQASLQTAFKNQLSSRYNFTSMDFVKGFQYDKDSNKVVVDIEKPKGERTTDLPRMAYYMEKDVKVLPLFQAQTPFQLSTSGAGTVDVKEILVYYVDEVAPTMTMKALTGGVIAVIVVVVLAVVIGLLILFFLRRREQEQYKKSQARELEPMS